MMSTALHNTKYTSGNNFQGFPINNDVLQKLQQEDVFCKNILNQIKKGNITDDNCT